MLEIINSTEPLNNTVFFQYHYFCTLELSLANRLPEHTCHLITEVGYKVNGQVAHTYMNMQDKGLIHVLDEMAWMLQVLITLPEWCDSVSKTYELLISGIFYLISSDHS